MSEYFQKFRLKITNCITNKLLPALTRSIILLSSALIAATSALVGITPPPLTGTRCPKFTLGLCVCVWKRFRGCGKNDWKKGLRCDTNVVWGLVLDWNKGLSLNVGRLENRLGLKKLLCLGCGLVTRLVGCLKFWKKCEQGTPRHVRVVWESLKVTYERMTPQITCEMKSKTYKKRIVNVFSSY